MLTEREPPMGNVGNDKAEEDVVLTCQDGGAQSSPFSHGNPLGDEHLHGGEGDALAQAFQHPDGDEPAHVRPGRQGSEQCEKRGEKNAESEDPLPAVMFSQDPRRDLDYCIAVEERAQDHALVLGVPVESALADHFLSVMGSDHPHGQLHHQVQSPHRCHHCQRGTRFRSESHSHY